VALCPSASTRDWPGPSAITGPERAPAAVSAEAQYKRGFCRSPSGYLSSQLRHAGVAAAHARYDTGDLPPDRPPAVALGAGCAYSSLGI